MRYHNKSPLGLSCDPTRLPREKGTLRFAPLPLDPSPKEEAVSDDTPKRPRGRPRLANPRRHVLHVRCTADEAATLDQIAAEAGMTVPDFMRDHGLWGKPPRSVRQPRVDREKLAQVLAELNELGPVMNDYARAVNTHGTLPTTAELVEIAARTKRMCKLLNDALGSRTNT